MNEFVFGCKNIYKFKPDCTKAIELAPNNLNASTNRGEAYKALGKTKEAETDFTNS